MSRAQRTARVSWVCPPSDVNPIESAVTGSATHPARRRSQLGRLSGPRMHRSGDYVERHPFPDLRCAYGSSPPFDTFRECPGHSIVRILWRVTGKRRQPPDQVLPGGVGGGTRNRRRRYQRRHRRRSRASLWSLRAGLLSNCSHLLAGPSCDGPPTCGPVAFGARGRVVLALGRLGGDGYLQQPRTPVISIR